jgi:hypothetical protein
MRKALIIAAMTIFVFGYFWQFGRWLLRWSGYGLGLRSLPGGYHEFVDSFAEKIAGASGRWTRQRRACDVIAGRFSVSGHSLRKTNGADAYGKTVWSRHPLLVPSCRWQIDSHWRRSAIKPAVTVTRRTRRRGEHGISRKAIAQGRPECFR